MQKHPDHLENAASGGRDQDSSIVALTTNINAKKPPVIYTVRIAQHWDGKLEFFVEDVADDKRSRRSIASALRTMADKLEEE